MLPTGGRTDASRRPPGRVGVCPALLVHSAALAPWFSGIFTRLCSCAVGAFDGKGRSIQQPQLCSPSASRGLSRLQPLWLHRRPCAPIARKAEAIASQGARDPTLRVPALPARPYRIRPGRRRNTLWRSGANLTSRALLVPKVALRKKEAPFLVKRSL